MVAAVYIFGRLTSFLAEILDYRLLPKLRVQSGGDLVTSGD